MVGRGQFKIAGTGGGDFRDRRDKSLGDSAAHEFFGDRLGLSDRVLPCLAAAGERFVIGPFRHPEKREKRQQRKQRDQDDRQRPAINREQVVRAWRWSFRVHSDSPEIA